jgi:hypothetical protein
LSLFFLTFCRVETNQRQRQRQQQCLVGIIKWLFVVSHFQFSFSLLALVTCTLQSTTFETFHMMAGSKMPIPQRRTAMHAGPGTLLMPELHLPKSHGRVNHHPRPKLSHRPARAHLNTSLLSLLRCSTRCSWSSTRSSSSSPRGETSQLRSGSEL